MKRLQFRVTNRRGSTLMIVLALLSLLMFLGMVFYTFAAQERAAADYFSEAAKSDVQVDDDPFPWGMEQLLTGAKNHQKQSVYWGPRSRHSMVRGVVGYDAVPHNGSGVNVIYNAAEIPEVDQDYDGTGDGLGGGSLNNPLNFVDSLVVWPATGGITPAEQEQQVTNVRGQFPEPDVDYTYPDINNIWLAYRGWAVRDNGAAAGAQRYQRVPVFIPSFMRPALLKSGTANGFGGNHAITDLDWYDHNAHPAYAKRSFRPSEDHIAGYDGSGNPIRRYIDQTNAADAALIATYGAFPLRPNEDVNPATFGELGLLTGHAPGTIDSPINFRLDSDNDGDGVFEGIWMDLGYPVQETASGDLYATLYSFTIYDLGSLIDLNSHGNISELVRTEAVTDQIAGGGGSTLMDTTLLSASDQGLSPSEVSPLWALAPIDPADLSTDPEFTDGLRGYGAAPTTRLEQANMEWLWLLTGRIDDTDQVWDGRWGDANALWLHVHGTDGSAGSNGARDIETLPRPGRAGRLPRITTNLIRFGDNEGFDDNADAFLGVAHQRTGVLRGFVHPLNIGGVGQSTESADPRLPRMARPDATVPDQWPQYFGYSLTGSGTNVFNEKKYLSGVDGTLSLAGDDLIDSPRYNIGFEDPDEMVNDVELAVRPDDAIFSSADIVPAHLSGTDVTSALSTLSVRLSNLATQAFASGSNISERFTTISNNLRTIPHRHDLGPNLESDGGTGDDGPRWWEWSADADGDNRLEFPPQFGTVPLFKPYIQSEAVPTADPFRPTVRRLLMSEAGESRKLTLQLPLSINHILDVNRTEDTPPETSPRFLEYLQRAGMRFRPLTEHPLASETSGGTTFSSLTDVPLADSPAGAALLQQFPPQTFAAREFWARRDRQKLARDIYVLLYTIGGGRVDDRGTADPTDDVIVDYRGPNNPTGPNPLYTHEQLRRMAQFAVNMVDAMDTDDVVTMFEYDKNLSDGWNLDDDPLTQNPAFGSGTVDDNDRGMYPFDAGDRGVVFGVEAQQLTLSESLAVRMEDFAKWNGLSDDSTTLFNDASGTGPLADPDNERRDRYMLHLELQNQQPYPVPLSVNGVTGTTNGEQAIWQLARVDRDSAVDAVQEPTLDPMASVSTPDGTTMSFMDGNTDIQGGQRFSIAMATVSNTNPGDSLRTDPLETGTADLYLQKPTATDYALISPDEPGITITGGAAVSPHCHLDTISTAHDGRYIYDDTVSDKGHFLREIPYADNGISYHGNEPYDFVAATQDDETSAATGQGFDVVLRRRMNPNLPLLPLAQNPWIEVDRTRVEFKDLFEISTSGMTVTATPDFANIESSERQEPLDAGSSGENHPPASTDPATDNYRYNTIAYSASSTSGANDITTAGSGVFNLWQPHFDRDFSSVVELFQLPVIGPRLLTQRLDRMRYAPAQQASDDYRNTLDANGDADQIGSAVAMFMQPDFLPVGADADDNAWYRLLQFLEVPSRVNSMLGNYLTRPTLPGKININGIRHIEVYAGLIDDNVIGQVPLAAVNAPGNDVGNHFHPFMVDATPGVGVTSLPTSGGGSNNLDSRDRWIELLMERDGATEVHDPVNNQLTMFWVPGTPNAKPFRSLGYRTPQLSSGSDASLDDTILRRLSADSTDGANETNRHWMEVGGTAFHNTPNTRSTQIQRHQVLGRIINNTTTVSNSFIVYGTAAYFRAYEHSSGLIRIGRRMGLDIDNDSDERNDAGWEKRAVFIIDRTELLNAHDEGTGSFDWQRLIKYRADLPSDSQ